MNDQNTYSFLFNGTPFTVTVACKQSMDSLPFVSLPPAAPPGSALCRRTGSLGHGPQNCSLTLSLNHFSLLHYPVKTLSIPSLLFTVRNPCRVCFQTAGVSCAQQDTGSSSRAGICAHVRGHATPRVSDARGREHKYSVKRSSRAFPRAFAAHK